MDDSIEFCTFLLSWRYQMNSNSSVQLHSRAEKELDNPESAATPKSKRQPARSILVILYDGAKEQCCDLKEIVEYALLHRSSVRTVKS